MASSSMYGWAGCALYRAPSWQGWSLAKLCPRGLESSTKECLFLSQKKSIKRVAITLLTSIHVTIFNRISNYFQEWWGRNGRNPCCLRTRKSACLKNSNKTICLTAPASTLGSNPTTMRDLHVVFDTSLPNVPISISIIVFGAVVWSMPIWSQWKWINVTFYIWGYLRPIMKGDKQTELCVWLSLRLWFFIYRSYQGKDQWLFLINQEFSSSY